MNIHIKRIYETKSTTDGKRILVDRLWPRGIKKEVAQIDFWPKALTPSNELRKWYHQDIQHHWTEFEKRYEAELALQNELIQQFKDMAKQEKLTLVTATKQSGQTHVDVLKRILEK